MANRGTIRFDDEDIRRKLMNGSHRARNYMSKITARNAARAEAFAKTHAAWRDRTGAARAGLIGEYTSNESASQSRWTISLYHSVSYSTYLETRFAGRYAIIQPTLDYIIPLYQADISRLFGEMYG